MNPRQIRPPSFPCLTACALAGLLATLPRIILAEQEQAEAPWRVVVQDINHFVPLDITREDSSVIGMDAAASHVFTVANLSVPEIEWVIPLPSPIVDAAASPCGGWFVVSTMRGIYRIDATTGEVRELLPEATGRVALDDSGSLLAVLGQFPLPTPDGADAGAVARTRLLTEMKTYSLYFLGVYDLERAQWTAVHLTRIRNRPQVVFGKRSVVAAGLGGNPLRHVSITYDCSMRLDLDTGETVSSRGPYKEGRRPISEPRDGEHAPDPDYRTPAAITRLQTALEAAAKELEETGINSWPYRQAHHARRPHVMLDLLGGLYPGEAAKVPLLPRTRSVLTMGPDGGLGIVPIEEVRYAFGRLLTVRHDFTQRHQVVADALSGEDLVASPDGRWLAFGPSDPDTNLVTVLSTDDGREILGIPRTADTTSGPPRAITFHENGDQLGVLAGRSLRIHAIPSGDLLFEKVFENTRLPQNLAQVGRHWLVVIGGDTEIVTFEGGEVQPRAIPSLIAGYKVMRAQAIHAAGDSAFLCETFDGTGLLINPENGQVLAVWKSGEPFRLSDPPEFPPRALPAYGGNLLMRLIGHAGAVELVDLASLTLVATVQPLSVPPSGDIVSKPGWVVFTPDGRWDASPGAETMLRVFRGRDGATGEQKQSRHEPGLLARLLAEAKQ